MLLFSIVHLAETTCILQCIQKNTGPKQLHKTYHVLFVGKHQDDTVEHKWIVDNSLKEHKEKIRQMFQMLNKLVYLLNLQPEIHF